MIPLKSTAVPLQTQQKPQIFSEAEQRRLKLKKATQAFESIFLAQLLKSMRSTSFNTGEESGFGKDIMMSLADEGVSQQFAKKGVLGIGKLLYDRLAKRMDAMPEPEHQLKMGRPKFVAPQPLPTAMPPRNLKIDNDKPVGASVTPIPVTATAMIAKPAEPRLAANLKSPGADSSPQLPALEKYLGHIQSAANETNLSEELLKSVIMRESGGNSQAVSRKGAAGLMQLMPDTAKAMGVNDPFDPKENILGGAKYLRSLLDRFGSLKTALAAYNAGPTTVAKHGGVSPTSETEKYVDQILSDLRKTK
jgi:soluble lytic murein transglycosylase-like protein